jgi:hypothetical protein
MDKFWKRTSSVRLGRTRREEVGRGWAGKRIREEAGPKSRKRISELKFGFFKFTKAWKFAQEDLGGILTWGFFLNSSRLLKDFRKNIICHAMECILYKIYF